MTGFKSFGNSTKVIDLAPGFTCIVGPNGSGKSNAIDALNFCLGTLSKKSMRAEKLTDLLFGGIKNKEPALKTIVEIELDNADLKIPVDEKIVVVSRELNRKGIGTYKLNGKRTTRSDILDKLRIANIDCVDGYNIIQQGQIGEIVGMSGIQRRELLEGVAGIGQFETKKENAIAELDEAQKKMGELNLLINELTYRVVQLKKEKEAAENWINLGNQIKVLNSELLSHRLIKIDKIISNLNLEVKSLNHSVIELEGKKQGVLELKNLEESVLQNQKVIDDLINTGNQLSEDLSDAKIELAKFEQLKDFNRESEVQKKEDLDKFKTEKDLASGSIEERRNQIQKITMQLQSLEKQREDLVKQRNQIEADISVRIKEYDDAEKDHKKILEDLQNINDDISNSKVSRDISGSIAESLQEQKAKIEKQTENNSKIRETNNSKIRSVQREIDRKTSKIQEIQVNLNEYEEKLKNQLSKIALTETDLKQNNEDNLVLKTKIDMIESSISSDDETGKAIQFILDNKSNFRGVIGTLETVLGGEDKIPEPIRYLRNSLVVDDLTTALHCIQKLKEKILGSCWFIPLQHVGITQQNIIEELETKITSSVIIVKDINEAVNLWKQNKSVQIQTVMGDIFYPNGLIEGGFHISRAKEQLKPLINLQKSINDDIDRLNTEKQMQERTINQIKKARDITIDARSKLEKTTRELIIQLQHLKENLIQENDILSRLTNELAEISKDEIEKKTEIDKFDREIEENNSLKSRIEVKLENSNLILDSLDVSVLRSKLTDLNERIIELEKRHIREEERRISLEKLIVPSSQRIGQIENEKARLMDDIQTITEKNKAIAEGIKSNIELIWQKEQASLEVNRRTTEVKSEITNLRRKIKQTNVKNSKIEGEIQSNRDKIHEVNIKRTKLETERESLFNEAKEKGLDIIEGSERLLNEIDPDNQRSMIKKLGNTRSKLEPVNMRSFDDFKEENKRLQEIQDSKIVLTEERKVILEIITQLEIEKLNTFMRTFNRINSSFNDIFYELANGEARLILENSEDIFEGGVSMEAHPDGKTLKTMESMSGGEKALTALAFIFAIQQSEPQPFYVLDEIDAALDVKNVDKVARLLAKMASGTSEFGKAQFIVISHRDILMAKAETIYGTTNVNGITQMMQLRLDEKGLSTN